MAYSMIFFLEQDRIKVYPKIMRDKVSYTFAPCLMTSSTLATYPIYPLAYCTGHGVTDWTGILGQY